MLGHLQALELMHGLNLLLTLGAGNVQRFVLLLDAGDFALNLLYPLVVGLLLSLVVLRFELANLFQFGLFLDLKEGLFNRLCEEDIKNRLHFTIVIK